MIQSTVKLRRLMQPATLSCSLRIDSVGSGLNQMYDVVEKEYIPDRSIAPLVLTPIVTAYAPDETLGKNVQRINKDCTFKWYYKYANSSNTWKEIPSHWYTMLSTGDDKGMLTFKNNTSVGSEMLIKVNVAYLDKRIGDNGVMVSIESEYLRLSANALSNIEQRLVISGDSKILFNPFVNINDDLIPTSFLKTINVKFDRGGVIYPTLPPEERLTIKEKNGNIANVGVSFVYDFNAWANSEKQLFDGSVTYNSKKYNRVDDNLLIEDSQWHLESNYGGILAFSSGSRRMVIRLRSGAKSVRVTFGKGMSGTSFHKTLSVILQEYNAQATFFSGTSNEETWVFSPSEIGDDVDIVLLIRRYFAIKNVEIIGINSTDVCAIKDNGVIVGWGTPASIDGVRATIKRNPISSVSMGEDGYDIVLDCGACNSAAYDVLLTDIDDTPIDVRELSFSRAFSKVEPNIISTYVTNDNNTNFPHECIVTCGGCKLKHPDNYFLIKWYADRLSPVFDTPSTYVGSGSKISLTGTPIEGGKVIVVGVEIEQKEELTEYYYNTSYVYPEIPIQSVNV